jgi:hypothetical protein
MNEAPVSWLPVPLRPPPNPRVGQAKKTERTVYFYLFVEPFGRVHRESRGRKSPKENAGSGRM